MTLTELMVATGITLGVTGAIFTLANPAWGILDAQPEAADVQQRVRVVTDTLTRALMAATTVRPHRVGSTADPPGTVRTDAIGLESPETEYTYYLERDERSGVSTLKRYDGEETDLPVVDHLVFLGFQYFGGPAEVTPILLDPSIVAAGGGPVRRVRVRVRIEAAAASLRGPAGPLFVRAGTSTSPQRWVPDQEVEFDVALRTRR